MINYMDSLPSREVLIAIEATGFIHGSLDPNEKDKERPKRLLNHIFLDYNLSLYLLKCVQESIKNMPLKEREQLEQRGYKKILDEWEMLQPTDVANAALIHDIGKELDVEIQNIRKRMGENIKDQHHILGARIGKAIGLNRRTYNVGLTHRLPTSFKKLNALDILCIISDCMTSQDYMTPEERLADMAKRWNIPQKFLENFHEKAVVFFKIIGINYHDEQAMKNFVQKIPKGKEEEFLRRQYANGTWENAIEESSPLSNENISGVQEKLRTKITDVLMQWKRERQEGKL